VSIAFGQQPTDHQAEQITEKLLTFHKEHLFAQVFPGAPVEQINFDLDWWNGNEVCLIYGYGTSSSQDYNINRQLLRYLEISVVPIVFFDDDVVLQLDSHDESLDEDESCRGCEHRYENYSKATVLSTSQTYNEFIGA
jgi:hypothetical protein